MQNATRFLLDESHAGVSPDDVPTVLRLRQRFPCPVEPDNSDARRSGHTLAAAEAMAIEDTRRVIYVLIPEVKAGTESGEPAMAPTMRSLAPVFSLRLRRTVKVDHKRGRSV